MSKILDFDNAVLSRKEAAAYLGICLTVLDRLNLPKIHAGRRLLFRKQAIDQWLIQQERGGSNEPGNE